MQEMETSARAVLMALVPARVARVRFSFLGVDVGPRDFAEIARLVENGSIIVYQERRSGGPPTGSIRGGKYEHHTNTLLLGPGENTTLKSAALIIHECAHAICDLRKLRHVTVGTAEAIGYIAQYLYLRVNMGSPLRIADDGVPTGGPNASRAAIDLAEARNSGLRVTRAASACAEGILSGKGIPTVAQLDLAIALNRHVLYRGRLLETEVYDGIHPR